MGLEGKGAIPVDFGLQLLLADRLLDHIDAAAEDRRCCCASNCAKWSQPPAENLSDSLALLVAGNLGRDSDTPVPLQNVTREASARTIPL